MLSSGPSVPDIQHIRLQTHQTSVGPTQEGEGRFLSLVHDSSVSWLALSAASLAQSAARQSHNLKVVSSSLTGGTF